jgi:asparagine synthase (glutamine-hydrolysing)
MLKLYGSIDTTSHGAAGQAELREPDAVREWRARGSSVQLARGPGWLCVAPGVAADGALVAAIQGSPIWRTREPAVIDAADDAHAVLAAYRLAGADFTSLLHGSFAVVLLDTARHTALLAVDRMGIERLAYAHDGERMTFATSAELVAREMRAAPIDRQALLSYLFFHMIPSPATIFSGVAKVPPACTVTFERGALRIASYWRPRFARAGDGSFEPLKASLDAALTEAVRSTQPDGATGAFLSGGLDSSTVAGYLARALPGPARTFSIGFGIDDYDELRFARIAGARFGFEAHEYQMQPQDVVDSFAAIARAYDEPFGNASALPTYYCARLARDSGVTHLLAGDGGDELFAGNQRYAEQRVFERYQHVPRLLRSALLEPVLRSLPPALQVGLLRRARNYVSQALTPLPDRLENWNFLHRLGHEAVLHPEFLAAIDTSAPLVHMRSVYNSVPSAEPLDRMLHYDWRFTLADNDLRKVGTMCDLAGVRVSYPMLHPDVIEVSLAVPPELKMRGLELRTFYKRAMRDFLPAEIIGKTKHGFGLPFGLWLTQSPRLAQLVQDNLASLGQRRLIRAEFLAQLRALHAGDDARYYGVFAWTLAMLEQWLQEHAVSL